MTATYIALATITLTSTDSEIVFSSIPATFRDLIVVSNHLGTTNATGGILRFNGDASSSYSRVFMAGGSFGVLSGAGTNTYADIFFPQTTVGVLQIHIMDYAQTNKHKTVLNRADTSNYAVWAAAARWPSTAAIHTIALSPDSGQWASGSTFSLFGIN